MRFRYLLLVASVLLSLAPGFASADDLAASPTGWIVGSHTLSKLLANDTEGTVTRLLDQQTTYVVVGRDAALPSDWTVTRTQTFTDADVLVDAVNQGKLLPHVEAVLLDIENWSFTPVAQQLDPGSAYDSAAAAAHAHGLKFVATPAMDLVGRLGRQSGETTSAAYLRLRLAARTGRYADVFEVQSQSLEEDAVLFSSTLAAAADQLRAVNPDVVVFGGVSTNHSGHVVTAEQMAEAIHAAPPDVTGYWLNDPAGGPFCPKCNGPYPGVAVQFLQLDRSYHGAA